MNKRPHIVIFNPDQWRGDVLGHMGNAGAVTPTLDAWMRSDAVSFRNAFCQNPVCTPSRCSFMTGWYPHVRGHRTMFHMLRPDEPCLLKVLKDAGYFVWWGGKNDLVPAQNGFSEYCDVKYQPTVGGQAGFNYRPEFRGEPGGDTYYSFYMGRLPMAPGDEHYPDGDWGHVLGAVEFLREHGSAAGERPLCIYLPLDFPHPTYGVEEPFYSMIDRAKLPPRAPTPIDWSMKPGMTRGIFERQNMQGWSESRWTELRATYYGMCARVDRQFAMVLGALKEAGIYDDTVIFFFSDHGDYTGDYGLVEKAQNTFEDCLTRVPFLVKPPKGVAVQPRVSDALVELIDFPATAFDLLGIEPGYSHFGRSLRAVLSGQTDHHRDAVFCEGGRLRGELHCTEAQSLPHDQSNLYWPRQVLQRGEGTEHTKAVMCRDGRFKYVRRLYESDELYDLNEDPREEDNRINDVQLAGPLRMLRERLLTFFLESGDVVPHDTDRRN